ncbi:MAG TPA: hypothetical protein VN524_07090 [Hyphomicrobiaceae bacterium]|nr:hypothetical protein [Hyphomicrobiaceae bacterium]
MSEPVDVMRLRDATRELPPVVAGALLAVLTRLVEGQEAVHARLDTLERGLKARGSL